MDVSQGNLAPAREGEGSSGNVSLPSPLAAAAAQALGTAPAPHAHDLRDYGTVYAAGPAAGAGHRQHLPPQSMPQPPQSGAGESRQRSAGTASPTPVSPLSYVQFGFAPPRPAEPADGSRGGMGLASAPAVSLAPTRAKQPPVKIVENPPDLDQWRQRLFDLDQPVVLTAEEHDTYFPWVDNVYANRSTQLYQRKRIITHYLECRLKGRPSGGPKKNADPNRKRRNRKVRELDLCSVKVRITEFPADCVSEFLQAGDVLGVDPTELRRAAARGPVGAGPFRVVQRIAAGGLHGPAGVEPPRHRHDLQKSDEIKKSTAHRLLAERATAAKRSLKPSPWKPRGDAAVTAERHAREADIKFYSASFCPFSHRVWIALEAKGIDYQYCETYPLRTPKPQPLLDANPRGLVPAIQAGDWACGESSIILEYLEDQDNTVPLYPTNPRLKANCRLWIDHINTRIVPCFYSVLVANEEEARVRCMKDLQRRLSELVQAADEKGPYFLGKDLCLVDVHLAPFAVRLRWLRPFVGLPSPVPEQRWQRWHVALVDHPHVRSTTSAEQLYTESMHDLLQGFMGMWEWRAQMAGK